RRPRFAAPEWRFAIRPAEVVHKPATTSRPAIHPFWFQFQPESRELLSQQPEVRRFQQPWIRRASDFGWQASPTNLGLWYSQVRSADYSRWCRRQAL